MSDPVESFLNEQKPMLRLVDEILDGWTSESCYQVPALVVAIATRLNWDSDQARHNDPIIRAYLKKHPTWYVTRGAHGGIMRRSEHEKKEAAKFAKEAAKEKAKQEITLALAAKMSQPTVVVPVPALDSDESEQDNTNIVCE
jgi:hypothetical protein